MKKLLILFCVVLMLTGCKTTKPTITPTATPSPSSEATATPKPTPTAEATATPTPTAEVEDEEEIQVTVQATPTPTPTAVPTATPTATPSTVPTVTAKPTTPPTATPPSHSHDFKLVSETPALVGKTGEKVYECSCEETKAETIPALTESDLDLTITTNTDGELEIETNISEDFRYTINSLNLDMTENNVIKFGILGYNIANDKITDSIKDGKVHWNIKWDILKSLYAGAYTITIKLNDIEVSKDKTIDNNLNPLESFSYIQNENGDLEFKTNNDLFKHLSEICNVYNTSITIQNEWIKEDKVVIPYQTLIDNKIYRSTDNVGFKFSDAGESYMQFGFMSMNYDKGYEISLGDSKYFYDNENNTAIITLDEELYKDLKYFKIAGVTDTDDDYVEYRTIDAGFIRDDENHTITLNKELVEEITNKLDKGRFNFDLILGIKYQMQGGSSVTMNLSLANG